MFSCRLCRMKHAQLIAAMFCGMSVVGALIAWGLLAASSDWSSWQGWSISIAEVILFVAVLPGILVVYALPMLKQSPENRREPQDEIKVRG